MGTDIHIRAEIRLAPEAPWEAVGSIFPNPHYDPVTALQIKLKRAEKGKEEYDGYVSLWNRLTTPEPYDGRNYTLFAALSDVRNGYGFAGVPTGEPIPYSVAAKRGLPNDLARHFNEERYADRLAEDEWGETAHGELSNAELADKLFIFGEHSQGWITLGELLNYDWDYEVTHYGLVAAAEFRRCYDSGWENEPRSWCGDISGANVVKLNSDSACNLIRAGEFPEAADDSDSACKFPEAADDDADSDIIEGRGHRPSYYVYHEWSHPLRQDVQDFLNVVDKMRHWGRDYELWHRDGNGTRNPKATMHDPSCIRLVFGYDS